MRSWFSLRVVVLVVSVTVVLAAVGFGAYVGIADSDLGGHFWQTVAAEFLAAALAVGVGVPAGLWLNDLSHRAEVIERRAQEDETRRQTLASLQRELEDARVWIDAAATVDTIRQPAPSTIRWEAASQAGNLRLLDAKTLDLVAVTYFMLYEVNTSCRRFHDARIGPAAAIAIGGTRAVLVAAEEVVQCAAVTGPHVASALERIRAVQQDADGTGNS